MEDFVYDVFNEERWWWSVGRRALIDKLWKRYGKRQRRDEAKRVLDIGCGPGSTLKEMEKVGAGYGLDVSETAAMATTMRAMVQRSLGRTCRLPPSQRT